MIVSHAEIAALRETIAILSTPWRSPEPVAWAAYTSIAERCH